MRWGPIEFVWSSQWRDPAFAWSVALALWAALAGVLGLGLAYLYHGAVTLFFLLRVCSVRLILSWYRLLGSLGPGPTPRKLCPPIFWSCTDLETRGGWLTFVGVLIHWTCITAVVASLFFDVIPSLDLLACAQLGWQSIRWQLVSVLILLTPLVIITNRLVTQPAQHLRRRLWAWGFFSAVAYGFVGFLFYLYIQWLWWLRPFVELESNLRPGGLFDRWSALPGQPADPERFMILTALAADVADPSVLLLTPGPWFMLLWSQCFMGLLWSWGLLNWMVVMGGLYRELPQCQEGAEGPLSMYQSLCIAQFVLEAGCLTLWFCVVLFFLLLSTHGSLGVLGYTCGTAGLKAALFVACIWR